MMKKTINIELIWFNFCCCIFILGELYISNRIWIAIPSKNKRWKLKRKIYNSSIYEIMCSIVMMYYFFSISLCLRSIICCYIYVEHIALLLFSFHFYFHIDFVFICILLFTAIKILIQYILKLKRCMLSYKYLFSRSRENIRILFHFSE